MIELSHGRPCWMRVRIHQTRQNQFPLQVDQFGLWSFGFQDDVVASHRRDPVSLNRHRLMDGKISIHRHNLSVVENQIGSSRRSAGAYQEKAQTTSEGL